MEKFSDLAGNTLFIGDKVAFLHSGRFSIGVIVNFTKKMVVVRYGRVFSAECHVEPSKIAKIINQDFDINNSRI